MSSKSDSDQPSVEIATRDSELRAHLARLLDRTDVHVGTIDPRRKDWWVDAARSNATVVLIEGDQAASERSREAIAELSARDEAPEVVVVGGEVDETLRAEILAAGAAGVIDEGPDLAEAVAATAAVLAERGPAQPDTGRSASGPRLSDFRSRSRRMREFLSMVERVKETDASLLITGETGVGKEHLARAIHAESARANGPFVNVNCGAIPADLLESELFGHEKGAFTGASSPREGRFREADGGTIFLDEIGELPKQLQVNLLTVLQRHEVRPLGSSEPVRIDVRVMAATNRDLAAEIEAGRFREDLYYRLHVVPLDIPPLRERKEDIPELVGIFMRHFRTTGNREEVTSIDESAMEALLRHDWPGNIRELVNMIERAVLLCRDGRITRADLVTSTPARSRSAMSPADAPSWLELPYNEAKKKVLDEFEERYFRRLLEATSGRVGECAQRAGIAARTLYGKMRRLGLDKEEFQE